jgi:formylmethanofuran dehydrogenase subunit E-like metal-binding protein
MGARSLLPIHSSLLDPFWFALFRKDTSRLVFAKWTDGAFHQQVLDASPEKILTRKAGKRPPPADRPNVFSVVSISRTWTANPPWPLLLAAAFHDHFCPGVNSGYCAGQYVMDRLPLEPGDKYVFVTAPAKCAADALQVMFNTTSGKSAGYSMAIAGDKLDAYASNGVQPMTVAMRVNQQKDVCTGLVLGFDWNKAYELTGVKADELAPQGGPTNPMFWIARVRMSYEMARMSEEQLKAFVVELKSFPETPGWPTRPAAATPMPRS